MQCDASKLSVRTKNQHEPTMHQYLWLSSGWKKTCVSTSTNQHVISIHSYIHLFFLNLFVYSVLFLHFFVWPLKKNGTWPTINNKNPPKNQWAEPKKAEKFVKKKATALPCYGLSNSPGSTFCREFPGSGRSLVGW